MLHRTRTLTPGYGLTEVSPRPAVEFEGVVGADIAGHLREPNGDTSRQAFRAETCAPRTPAGPLRAYLARPLQCCGAPRPLCPDHMGIDGGLSLWYVCVPVSCVFFRRPARRLV